MGRAERSDGAQRRREAQRSKLTLSAHAHKGTSLVSLSLEQCREKHVSILFLAIGHLAGIYAADCGRQILPLDSLEKDWKKHVSILFQGS